MSDILVEIIDQEFTYIAMPLIGAKGVEENRVVFTFSPEWSGYSKTATFYHELYPDNIYDVVITNDACVVPHEVTDTPGKFFIGVTGVSGDVTRTSILGKYYVYPGSEEGGETSQAPTPGVYDQMLQIMNASIGSPLVANTASAMTDKTKIYVYTGSESGYVSGNWYYWTGSLWSNGGVYNSQGIGRAFEASVADMVKQSTVATESDKTPYLYRPTPNPSAILADEKIIGGTVAHNQLMTDGDFPNTTNWTAYNGTIAASSNVLTYTTTTQGTSDQSNRVRGYANLKNGHKYLVSLDMRASVADVNIMVTRATTSNRLLYKTISTSWENYANIESATADGTQVTVRWANAQTVGGVNDTLDLRNFIIIDLTAMFGSTIADYLYTLESGTAGAGAAKLKEWGFLSKAYYAYDAGSLQSVKTTGKKVTGSNIFGGSLMREGIKAALASTTEDVSANTISYAANATYIQDFNAECGLTFKENTQYTFIITCEKTSANSANMRIAYTDGTIENIGDLSTANTKQTLVRVTAAGKTVDRFYKYYANSGTVKIYCEESGIFEGANHAFAPYKTTTYPTTDTELRGIPKLDANNQLYYDGDVYEADGTVTRKFGTVDLSQLTWTVRYTGSTNKALSAAVSADYPQLSTNFKGDKYPYIGSISGAAMLSDPDSLSVGIRSYKQTTATETSKSTSLYIVLPVGDSPSGNLVYPLFALTTDTATPYTATQIVGKGGTEEWIDSRSVPVPVGHETVYGIGVPDVPSNANNATLHATVTNGKLTLTWS